MTIGKLKKLGVIVTSLDDGRFNAYVNVDELRSLQNLKAVRASNSSNKRLEQLKGMLLKNVKLLTE